MIDPDAPKVPAPEDLPTPLDVETMAKHGLQGASRAAASDAQPGFSSWLWRRYRDLFKVTWDRRGEFRGRLLLEPLGPQAYRYTPDPVDPFRFVRSSGEVVQPGALVTDGGTIPRIAWLIPSADPWTFLKAYILHDWECARHHCDPTATRSFADANDILGEGIYTLMADGCVEPDWKLAAAIVTAVDGKYGRAFWDYAWPESECAYWYPRD